MILFNLLFVSRCQGQSWLCEVTDFSYLSNDGYRKPGMSISHAWLNPFTVSKKKHQPKKKMIKKEKDLWMNAQCQWFFKEVSGAWLSYEKNINSITVELIRWLWLARFWSVFESEIWRVLKFEAIWFLKYFLLENISK
jgi:hypothetical protein